MAPTTLHVAFLLHCLSLARLGTFATFSSTLFYVKGNIYPFQNTSLSWDERVDDLVARLTLDEITIQMSRGGAGEYGGPAPAIPRLGIGAYNWNTECLRGDVDVPENATAFPQAIGLAATFSPMLMFNVSSAVGAEVRGKHNDFVRRGVYGTHTGASCFSPVVNIARDSRWGRIQETYGEDPFLSGKMAQSFIYGLQGTDSRYVQATAGCKHFDAHGGPENIPVSRESFDAKVSDVDWHMTFLPAFRDCVEAGTFSLMCSYNRLNGVPACANKKLLSDVLRDEWGFKGYVVSDESAIENIIYEHHYLNNSVDTAAACVNAGTNLELSPNMVQPVFLSIGDAVRQGKLTEATVRERVKPLFYTRMRLGEFDSPDKNPYAKLDSSVTETPQHRTLAVDAAIKSFVLLKNKNNALPLKPEDYHNVVVLGPMANNYDQQFGDYSPRQDRSFTKTPMEGLKLMFKNVQYQKVCMDGTRCLNYVGDLIPAVVRNADLIFLVLGTGQAVESEANDRPNLNLPGHQKDLVLDVINNSRANIIMLLFSAGPLNVTFADQSDRVTAIMECFFPAQATGDALINVLTNKGGNSSPAGRLPLTWPMSDSQLPPMVNYSMVGRTYRYLKTDPLYPFGYGLSYSSFSYNNLTIPRSVGPMEDIHGTLIVTNNGKYDADEVIQCYLTWETKTLPVPIRQLAYFNRIHLKAAQKAQHFFNISWKSWSFWDKGQWVVQAGKMSLYCGGQQPFQKKSAPSNILSAQFVITDTVRLDKLMKSNKC